MPTSDKVLQYKHMWTKPASVQVVLSDKLKIAAITIIVTSDS